MRKGDFEKSLLLFVYVINICYFCRNQRFAFMEERKIVTSILVYSYDELSEQYRQLIDEAKRVTGDAEAPYSKLHVAAAVLLENGETVNGTNQENAAYPSGLCAERVTMFYANSKYPNVAPKALAIATFADGDFLDEPITPCGACRQVMVETEKRFGRPMRVLLCGAEEVYVAESASSLLPLSFDF